MAYTDFTNFAQLKAEFGIVYQKTPLYDKTKLVPLAPTETLKTMLRRAQYFPLTSEKAKSEGNVIISQPTNCPCFWQIFNVLYK